MPRFLPFLLLLLIILTACGEPRLGPRTPTPEPSPSSTRPPPLVSAPLQVTRPPEAMPTVAGGCPVSVMLPWQHISASGSYTQTQTEAAGSMRCRVARNSCAYDLMIGNHSPTIVFKGEEEPPYNDEDFRMHPAMLLPLTRLDALVQAEWGGTYWLRVTDAYDSLLEHDLTQSDPERKNSLHFEGRAIDLTLWPIDQSQYGRLCALAHCAGFDWVHHEVDHCHAAIAADSLCSRCGQ